MQEPGLISGPRRPSGVPSALRVLRAPLVPLVLLVLSTAACEVDWGGSRVELREPELPEGAREEEGSDAPTAEREPAAELPLPEGPLLYLARLDRSGAARAVPIARLGPGGPSSLGWPSGADESYRGRFDSAFAPAGVELPLLAAGARIGSWVAEPGRSSPRARCPSVRTGRVLLPPGAAVPEFAVFTSDRAGTEMEITGPPTPPARRARLFGPILAERLLGEAGIAEAFLARPASRTSVRAPGGGPPDMAATYLIRDTLAVASPRSPFSASLVFVARADTATSGYVPRWHLVGRYDQAGDRAVHQHLARLPRGGTSLDLLRELGAEDERLAAVTLAPTTAGRGRLPRPDWREEGPCRALELLRSGAPGP